MTAATRKAAIAKFKGTKEAHKRRRDEFKIMDTDGCIIVGVLSSDGRDDSAMSISPKTARAIAAELVWRADKIEAAK